MTENKFSSHMEIVCNHVTELERREREAVYYCGLCN